MKRMLCLLAALLLLPCAALASSAVDDAISYASGSLTEVYSYTAEDAAAFTFEVEETDEGVVVTYFNHPGLELHGRAFQRRRHGGYHALPRGVGLSLLPRRGQRAAGPVHRAGRRMVHPLG